MHLGSFAAIFHMVRQFTFLLVLAGAVSATVAQPADTLRISIAKADSIFLRNSFALLAAELNIEEQRAMALQAKLYPNPVFTADFNAYDPENGRAFHIGPTGQMGFQFEQLILLGGKRKAQIELARTDILIAELEFQDMVRQLRFELHTGLHALNQQGLLLRNYNAQLSLLDTILSAYGEQSAKGNIALREVVRLKGVYLKLNNDRAELLKDHLAQMARVQTILQVSVPVSPVIPPDDLDRVVRDTDINELTTIALENRADLLIARQQTESSKQYLRLQRSLAVPDLNVFTSYDQRSGAFQNQVNMGVAIPLPLWNRNQGNIRAACARISQAEYTEEGMRNQVLADLRSTYALYLHTVGEYRKSTALYDSDFELTFNGMSDNFRRRNVGLLEFVDFFESYNDALAELARIRIQLAESAEMLNLTVGKTIF